jgi:putative copper resistance protein D
VVALAAVRAVHFAFAIQSIGALLFVWIVRGAPVSATTRYAEGRWRWLVRAAAVSAAATLVSGGVWAALQAADIAGTDPLGAIANGAVGKLMWQTHAGTIWRLRFWLVAALAFVTILLSMAPHPPAGAAVTLALALAAATFISSGWLSHAAADATPLGPLHLAVHALHMFGVALWLGGLLPLAMLLMWARRTESEEDLAVARHAAVRFGNIALLAVGLILVSGIVNSALVVDSAADLARGAFARLLAAKLILFMLLLCLAANNRLRLVPELAGGATPSLAVTRLCRSVWGELMLAALILAIVGVLGITPPGTDEG